MVLVLNLVKDFERVSLLVVWAWATHFSFPRKVLRVLCGYSSTRGKYILKDTISAILPVSKWSCFLLRIVLQHEMSAVTKTYHPLKLMVFVDDITALLKGVNREVAEMAKKVMKKLKEEVERRGLGLSVHGRGNVNTARK